MQLDQNFQEHLTECAQRDAAAIVREARATSVKDNTKVGATAPLLHEKNENPTRK